MQRHRLDDTTWERIYRYLKSCPKIHSSNEAKCRQFVDAVHWRMRTGVQWRDLPEEFGRWNSIFKRFGGWADKGIWDGMHEYFIDEPDMEWLLLDSTIVRAHPCAAGAPKEKGGQEEQALGKSVGGFSTKIHATADALGNPLRLLLTGGQRADSTQAIALIEGFDFEAILADRGYDTDHILDFVAQNHAEAVIPAKKNRLIQRDTDWHTYKDRHLVECFMNKIKQYRCIFSRFEKYASRYKALISFASALIWLR
ncbi:IS5 family transposase [Chloroflexi bacterium TSY]|nr:IS5 family transposase [Chloroflexi bacterium TSY]